MKAFLRFIVFISLFLFFSCKDEIPKQTFLALGDSYTIGESVGQNERWPEQLTLELAEKSIALAPPTIIAKTGWTTDELQDGINQAPFDYPYDWVSLLIGVNNQYRGLDIETFKEEFENLLSQAIIFSGNKNAHVFVISIPDWGVMPFAKSQNQEKIATEIDDFNQAIYEICIHNNIRFVEWYPSHRYSCQYKLRKCVFNF